MALRDDTASFKEFMLDKAREQYVNLLRSFKINKIHPWLDEWEAVMLDCIKYDLPEIQRGLWLKDLANRKNFFPPRNLVAGLWFHTELPHGGGGAERPLNLPPSDRPAVPREF